MIMGRYVISALFLVVAGACSREVPYPHEYIDYQVLGDNGEPIGNAPPFLGISTTDPRYFTPNTGRCEQYLRSLTDRDGYISITGYVEANEGALPALPNVRAVRAQCIYVDRDAACEATVDRSVDQKAQKNPHEVVDLAIAEGQVVKLEQCYPKQSRGRARYFERTWRS